MWRITWRTCSFGIEAAMSLSVPLLRGCQVVPGARCPLGLGEGFEKCPPRLGPRCRRCFSSRPGACTHPRPSWVLLGPSWSHLGGTFGLCWGHRVPCWGSRLDGLNRFFLGCSMSLWRISGAQPKTIRNPPEHPIPFLIPAHILRRTYLWSHVFSERFFSFVASQDMPSLGGGRCTVCFH